MTYAIPIRHFSKVGRVVRGVVEEECMGQKHCWIECFRDRGEESGEGEES